MSPEAITSGMAIGLAVAAPIGPMSLLCLQRSVAGGERAGLAVGFGAATMHLAWGTAAVAGLGAAGSALNESQALLSIASALILLWFAWSMASRPEPALGSASARHAGGPARAYAEAVLLGATNPLTLVLFAAVLPALAPAPDPGASPFVVAGIFLGSLSWWTAFSLTASRLRARIKPAWLVIASRCAGLAFALAAVGLVIRAARLA